MVLANIEWTGALCTILALACAAELVVTASLTFAIPHFLAFCNSQIATGAGVIAGCVTLPTVMRIKTSKITPNMNRIYGYTIWYQRLAIGVCAFLHVTASTLCLVAILDGVDFQTEFFNIMGQYHGRVLSKALVDNIQWNLQCCGSNKYSDWFGEDWGGYNFDETHDDVKKYISDLLSEDTDKYPDLSTIRNDAVPFSCCRRRTISPCIHTNLARVGTSSISIEGCALKLTHAINFLLWMEFLSYCACVVIEVLVIFLLFRTKEGSFINDNSEFKMKRRHVPKTKWSKFSNEEGQVAKIEPTILQKYYLPAAKNMLSK